MRQDRTLPLPHGRETEIDFAVGPGVLETLAR